MDWIKFFSQHRKLGYNVILIAQSDKMLDKQIRSLIEYDVKHIKMNNSFFFFLPTSFLAVEKWYGQHMKLGTQVIWYRKRIAAMYDSYALFDALADEDGAQGEPRSGGSPCAVPAPPAKTNSASPAVHDGGGAELAENAEQLPPIGLAASQVLQDEAGKNSRQDFAQHFGAAASVQPDEMREPLADRIKTRLHQLRQAVRQACGRVAALCTMWRARFTNKKEG